MKGIEDELQRMRESNNGRGSVRNQDRLEAFSGRGGRGTADWGACDGELLAAVVVGITTLGGAVTFGLSRDKGAHQLTLMLDDKRQSLWFNGDADLNEALQGVVDIMVQIM